jgi:methyl-accepting chemotaxis protein
MSKQPANPVTATLNTEPPPPGRVSTFPRGPSAGASSAGSADRQQIERMALSAVRLAALGPQLAALAVRMDEQANAQARQAEGIAAATRELTERLGAVVGRLQAATGNVHAVMQDIARIADQTRILSINASIEAARAGEHGRAFSIVAREVQELADQTRGSTQLIGERVRAIQGSVGEVAGAVSPVSDAASGCITVQSVNSQVQVMAGTAEKQRDGAKSLRTLGDQANRLTEELLFSVGTFRLGVHRRAGNELRELLPELAPVMEQPGRSAQILAGWLVAHPGFELLYATDTAGRQITGNIGWRDGRIATDSSVCGKSWRDRPWFVNALRKPDEVTVSDIYRSAATGDYCFTVSALVRSASGLPLGVLAADVNFQKLLSGDERR